MADCRDATLAFCPSVIILFLFLNSWLEVDEAAKLEWVVEFEPLIFGIFSCSCRILSTISSFQKCRSTTGGIQIVLRSWIHPLLLQKLLCSCLIGITFSVSDVLLRTLKIF